MEFGQVEHALLIQRQAIAEKLTGLLQTLCNLSERAELATRIASPQSASGAVRGAALGSSSAQFAASNLQPLGGILTKFNGVSDRLVQKHALEMEKVLARVAFLRSQLFESQQTIDRVCDLALQTPSLPTTVLVAADRLQALSAGDCAARCSILDDLRVGSTANQLRAAMQRFSGLGLDADTVRSLVDTLMSRPPAFIESTLISAAE